MHCKFIFISVFISITSLLFCESVYAGLWSDETRQTPDNPTFFLCIEELKDGRFFIIQNSSLINDKPYWEASIGTLSNGHILVNFHNGEWMLKHWKNKMGIDLLQMESKTNSDAVIGLGRLSEQPIRKIEESIKGNIF